ncbi:unnamed protein product [Moneuplotes crassus]|uniref:Uncharacterized protein n=1 Tax=Euplotes crassus TaxID=5936 RepID=A0AAD2DAX5_EUPCR|nr:unnamed protein product [Moneuplotes crassus]
MRRIDFNAVRCILQKKQRRARKSSRKLGFKSNPNSREYKQFLSGDLTLNNSSILNSPNNLDKSLPSMRYINLTSPTSQKGNSQKPKCKKVKNKLVSHNRRISNMRGSLYHNDDSKSRDTSKFQVSKNLTLFDVYKKFENYKENSKNFISPQIVRPRTQTFSALVSSRKDLEAADYSIIASLKAENDLITKELEQLRIINEKLMCKIDNFEKHKRGEMENSAYELEKIDKGMKEILEDFYDGKNNVSQQQAKADKRITINLLKFCFDQITQLKIIFCSDIAEIKKDFSVQIEELYTALSQTATDSYHKMQEYEQKLQNAGDREANLKEELLNYQQKYKRECEKHQNISLLKDGLELEKQRFLILIPKLKT